MSLEEGNVTNDKTEELCQLFTSTVTSLSADSEALKQLICLKMAIGIDLPATNDGENMDPNVAASRSMVAEKGSHSIETIENLQQIELAVSELEQKAYALRDIVAEEQRALRELEVVKHAAEAQNKVLNHMVNASRQLRLPGDNISIILNRNDLDNGDRASRDLRLPRDSPSPFMSRNDLKHCDRSGKWNSNRVIQAQRRKKEHNQMPRICIPFVTESELKGVPRTIRGRITHIVLNDAISDIEKVCKNKYEVLHHRRKPAGERLQGGRALQLERQYRQQLITHRELQVEEHGDRPWVSEQDLRQSCAFFRSGESTARAILTLLRTLKRLKQVPGKKTCEVTYFICQNGSY